MKLPRMKILHVGNHVFPCMGGVESVIWNMARAQAESGNEVSILVFDTCTHGREKLPPVEKREKVTIYRVPQAGLRFYRLPPYSSLMEYARKQDIIHVHGFGPWLDMLAFFKRNYSAKLILNTHGGFFHTQQRKVLKSIYSRILLPLIWNRIDQIIFDSESDQQHFSHLSLKRTQIVPNGIDVKRFTSLSLSKKKATELLFVSRLSQNKRLDRLLEAFFHVKKKNPLAHLHIAGEDWEGLLAGLQEKAKTMGIGESVSWHGKVSDEKLNELYERCGIFASASEYEGFGITVVESMAAGCIPCLNDIPPFRVFVKGDEQLITDFSNSSKAASDLLRLIVMPLPKAREMRKKIRAWVNGFSLESVAQKNLEIYFRALKKEES